MLELTAEIIQQDIAEYSERIRAAQDKLAQLPMTDSHWRELKKLTSKRRHLKGEIAHVKKLIGMAEESLRETHNGLHGEEPFASLYGGNDHGVVPCHIRINLLSGTLGGREGGLWGVYIPHVGTSAHII